MKFDLSWFKTIPGLLITFGVVLLIVALIIFIVTSSKNKKECYKERQILFDKYVAKHNSKFADEFNVRMEKYNIELIQIKV